MKSVIIDDRLYGTHKFTEPVLVELINSDAVQRLKGIAQWGVPNAWYHKKGFSRFEHSVGVAILLARLGASLKEQIAGLLHDVSHMAFSHVVDYVVGTVETEDFQDRIFFRFISSDSQIPSILKNNRFDVNDFKDIKQFTLLERPEPELCADRIDYSLRELLIDGKAEVVKVCLRDIKVADGRICFGSKETAKSFALNVMDLQKNHWGNYQAVTRYHILAGALREALEREIISFDDFRKDDAYIIEKLEASNNPKIRKNIELLVNGNFAPMKNESKKVRCADPYYLENGKLLKLSEQDSEFRDKLTGMMRR
jgi:HD superfamily phosphohydrolase